MILECFMYKMAFDDRIDHENCCDNCVYNHGEVKQIPVFEIYDVTAKLGMIYASITEYSDLLLLGKCQKLLAGNPAKGLKTAPEQTYKCEKALNNFALQTWPNDELASLKLPITWRQRLAKVAFRITSVGQLHKELLSACLLCFSSLGVYADELVNIIVTSV